VVGYISIFVIFFTELRHYTIETTDLLLLLLHTEMVYMSTATHPSSNRARCWAKLLIETNALTSTAGCQTIYLLALHMSLNYTL